MSCRSIWPHGSTSCLSEVTVPANAYVSVVNRALLRSAQHAPFVGCESVPGEVWTSCWHPSNLIDHAAMLFGIERLRLAALEVSRSSRAYVEVLPHAGPDIRFRS